MKNNPLFYKIAESFESMFVVDKRGKMIFFPWGAKKQGYYIKNENVVAKAKKFYTTSYFVCFVVIGITISIFNTFWAVIGSLVFFFGLLYLAYYLYTSRITASLPRAKASYKEVILEKLEPSDEEDETLPKESFSAQWSTGSPQIEYDTFSGLTRYLFRFTPGQLFLGYFFLGVVVIMAWSKYHPQEFGKSSEDFLVACVVCFLWGLAFFILNKNMESEKPDWWGFLQWKLPMIFMVIVFWALAVLSLYKFVVMIIV